VTKKFGRVVPAAALSWHCITLPSGLHKQKNRLLPVLQSLLEEHLLDEPENVHIALQPNWQAGSPAWVATCQKAWLRTHLNQLQNMGHHVHRIVPEWTPAPLATNSGLQAWVSGVPEDAWLWISQSQGAWRLPLQAGIQWWAEQLNATPSLETHERTAFDGLTVQAEPAVANLAQQSLQTCNPWWARKWPTAFRLGAWWPPLPLSALRKQQPPLGTWPSLILRRMAAPDGVKAFKGLGNNLHDTAWRPVRWSLAILIAVQWVGLNAVAWQLNDKVKAQREQQKNILTQTFPNVPVVDASLQMSRELERLQRQAGSLNAKDLESVLQAIGMALPDGQSINALDFQAQGAGEIRLQGLQMSNEQQTQFVNALRAKGYDAQANAGQWRIVNRSLKQGAHDVTAAQPHSKLA
jgi:general secretion pathway protein L